MNHSFQSSEMASTLRLYASNTEIGILVSFAAFFGCVGFLGNLVMILSIVLTEQFADTPSNVFVLSLAFADLLVCGVSGPLFIYSCYHPTFTTFITASKFTAVASTGSIFTLSLDRHISLVRGLKYPKIMTFKRTVSLVAGTWIVASLVVILAVVGILVEIKPLIHITRYFVGFYITATIVMYMYMYYLGGKHRKKLARQAYAVTGQVQAKFAEFRALRSLFMIAGTFALFWLPVTVAAFFINVQRDPFQFYRSVIYTAPLCAVNSVADPAVYYYRSNGFRKSIKILVRRLKNLACD